MGAGHRIFKFMNISDRKQEKGDGKRLDLTIISEDTFVDDENKR